MNKIKVKYLQPIESVYVKLQDGTDFHWFNTKLIPANQQQTDLDIEWINGRPCRVSYLQGGESKEVQSMSKWKSNDIKIIQAFLGNQYGEVYGLGDDQKIYKWDEIEGGWKKHYKERDLPDLE